MRRKDRKPRNKKSRSNRKKTRESIQKMKNMRKKRRGEMDTNENWSGTKGVFQKTSERHLDVSARHDLSLILPPCPLSSGLSCIYTRVITVLV